MPIPHEEYKVAYVTSITDPGWWGVQAYVNAGTSFSVFFFFFFFFLIKISDSTGITPCTPWRCPCLQDRRSQSVLPSACGEKPASFGVFHCKIMIGSVFTYNDSHDDPMLSYLRATKVLIERADTVFHRSTFVEELRAPR